MKGYVATGDRCMCVGICSGPVALEVLEPSSDCI